MPTATMTTGVNDNNYNTLAAVPYYTGGTNNNGIPNIGITQTGAAALSNAQLTINEQNAGGMVPGSYTGPLSNKVILGQPFAYFVGAAIVLLLLHWLSQSDAVPGTPAPIRGSLTNLLIIGLSSVLFISGSKALLTRFPVPGLTTLMSGV